MARLVSDETTARRLAHLVEENFDGAAVSAFEVGDRWIVEVILSDTCDRDGLSTLLRNEVHDLSTLTFEPLAERDWVATSLTGLKPVTAGRFFIHGAHDRALLPANAIGIEIEAALAFGTGHHGTTRGCLLALDRVLRRSKPARVLDVGTGTGVLAIAAALAARVPVTATDIDPVACRAARGNAELNHAKQWITVLSSKVKLSDRYDVILANILALPLIAMSRRLSRLVAPGAHLILSGLMAEHAGAVIAAYVRQGLSLERRMLLEGWVTLTLRRGR